MSTDHDQMLQRTGGVWQSRKPEVHPAELEEERDNCFMAIKRTRKAVVITQAASYQGQPKQVSGLVAEVGLVYR